MIKLRVRSLDVDNVLTSEERAQNKDRGSSSKVISKMKRDVKYAVFN